MAGTREMAESDVSVLTSTDRCSGEMEERMETTYDSAIADEHSEHVTAFEGEMQSSSCTTSAELRREHVVWLEQVQRQCKSEEEFVMAASKPNWTEVEEFVTAASKPNWTEVAPMSSSLAEGSSSCMSPVEKREIVATNQRFFQGLIKNQPPTHRKDWMGSEFSIWLNPFASRFFADFEDRLDVGKKIAEGGQAEIYEAFLDGKIMVSGGDDEEFYVLKVFKFEHSEWFRHKSAKESECIYMQDHELWPCVLSVCTLLKDGRFAFLMVRYWGDLRKAINAQILKDRTHLMPPFPPHVSTCIIYMIANGMRSLHRKGILHRDLKADNVFIYPGIEEWNSSDPKLKINISVGDFESSEGVMGTRFWRAPEVLGILRSSSKDKFSDPTIWTEKVDVYAYAMTCYEVLSGCIPFQNRAQNDYNIGDERPLLPDYVDSEIQELLRKCWDSRPSVRPSFEIICEELKHFVDKKLECYEALVEDGRDDNGMSFFRGLCDY